MKIIKELTDVIFCNSCGEQIQSAPYAHDDEYHENYCQECYPLPKPPAQARKKEGDE